MDKILFLDFDNLYKDNAPPSHYIVLTNGYNNEKVYNVKSFDCRDIAYEEFEFFNKEVELNLKSKGYDLRLYKLLLFNNFFYPLAQWLKLIDFLIGSNRISKETKIIFSSYSRNSKVFLLEAEGEVNSKFLYKSYYYLSYYIRKFLKDRNFQNIEYQRERYYSVIFNLFLRSRVIFFAKLLQLLFYRFFTLKRKFGKGWNTLNSGRILFSTRGIVQTEFISNLYKTKKQEMIMFVNEASSLPFKNLNFSKRIFEKFYYAEGNLGLKRIISRSKEFFKTLNFNNSIQGMFLDLELDLKDIFPEVALLDFHMKTYGDSVIKSIKDLELNSIKKIVSFEMLFPFCYYMRPDPKSSIIQMQTTLLANQKDPDYVYSDKFYFYNKEAFLEQSITNSHFSSKFDFIGNLKYINVHPEPIKDQINNITYFVQPIHLDEELKIIKILEEFAILTDKHLVIKLHPRSNIGDYQQFKHLEFSGLQALEAIRNADLVVTRTSSIGLDCWFLNVPVIFFANGLFNGFKVNYIPENYLGTIRENINANWLSDNLQEILFSFYNHELHRSLNTKDSERIKVIFQSN